MKKKRMLSLITVLMIVFTYVLPIESIALEPWTLFPNETIEANLNLDLHDYTDEQLESFSLDTILQNLTDEEGNKINIPANASTVWIDNDEYLQINNGDTFDLSRSYSGEKLYWIIGSGKQLDPDNVYYNIKIFRTVDVNPGIDTSSLYLPLSSYSKEQLKTLSVEDIFDRLVYEDGSKAQLSIDSDTLWLTDSGGESSSKPNNGYTEYKKSDSVDLSELYGKGEEYRPAYIGTGERTSDNNLNCSIKIYSRGIAGSLSCGLINEENIDLVCHHVPNQAYNYDNIYLYNVACDNYESNKNYRLKLATRNMNLGYSDVDIDIYTFEQYRKYCNSESVSSIKDEIITDESGSYSEVWEKIAGYDGVFDEPLSPNDTKNVFVIVYKDKNNNQQLYNEVFAVVAQQDHESNTFEGGVICNDEGTIKGSIDPFGGYVGDSYGEWNYNTNEGIVTLPVLFQYSRGFIDKNCSADSDYTVILEKLNRTHGGKNRNRVLKAVKGFYKTIDETASLENLDDKLFFEGYKAPYQDWKNGIDFTIFYEDGFVYRSKVILEISDSYEVPEMGDYNKYKKPAIRKKDPLFSINGALTHFDDGNKYYDSYIVENSETLTLDTYYANGYQTMLVNKYNGEDGFDISKVYLDYETVNDNNIAVYAGNSPLVKGSPVDFSNETVNFGVRYGSYTKQYQVSVVEKEKNTAKLFVNGPETREVFFDDFYGDTHDVFIANVGDQQLTGLKVELLDAQNIKLDNYWSVGGDKNNTLAAFDSNTVHDRENKQAYNVGKIRLLPILDEDGDVTEGEIKGTLRITADGQEPVNIKLIGYAGNPNITISELDNAVKYVPYSNLVATNNMHDWIDVRYSIYDGKLPDGVTLNSYTGEIYGTPQESGEFDITVEANYTSATDYIFSSSYVDLTLTVEENTNKAVYEQTDPGYEILDPIGVDITGNYDFYLYSTDEDQVFRSKGRLLEFQDFWLNGEKLVEGEDYTKEEGSTRITINKETIETKSTDGTNTIAAEFRVDGDRDKELKRSAQNYTVDTSKNPESSGKVTFVSKLIDSSGNKMPNKTIEMHSEVKVEVTNKNGFTTFKNLEIADHNVYIKGDNGLIEASKKFSIVLGNTLSLNGNTITASDGDVFTVTMKVVGDTIEFVSLEKGDKSNNSDDDSDDSSSKGKDKDSSNSDDSNKDSSKDNSSSANGNNPNGNNGTNNAGNNGESNNSPDTGSKAQIPFLLVAISAASMIAVRRKNK